VPGAQLGTEKGYSLALTANAGATLINESARMYGSLMDSFLEGFVIDNDLLGLVKRTVTGIEVTDDMLSYKRIRTTVFDEGNFLDKMQTIKQMETD
jgi:trimethylamine--corrinoid protein Co-methyltransferase